MPRVSVLMPVYNTKEEYLREAIESILNQTYTDFEFIILNDSPENSDLDGVINSYKDNRIKYYKNEKNLGISKSRNKLLDLANGEYIAVFDHDDISLPERLEKEVEYLDSNKQIGAVSCNFEWMSSHKKTDYPTDNISIKFELMNGDVFLHTGMMIRKSVLNDNNIRYEEEYTPAEDYMLCMRLIKHTMLHNLKDVLVRYRDSEDNTTNRTIYKMLDRDMMIKNIAFKEYPYCRPAVRYR